MTFEEGLYAYLTADQTLADLVPGGIYPVKRPQRGGYPALSYFRIGNQQLDQPFDAIRSDVVDKGLIQISVWVRDTAGGYPALLAIETRLLDLLDGKPAAMSAASGCDVRYLKFNTAQDLYEDEDRIFHRPMELTFIAMRS